MRITLRSFGPLREVRGGRGVEDLDVPVGASVGAVVAGLALPAGLPVTCAVNESIVPRDTVLVDGDELALLPPVGGG